MNHPTIKDHAVHTSDFWNSNEEPAVGIFIVAHQEGYRAIKKTVTSIQKLGYENLKIYLIDTSTDNLYKAKVKKLSVKYISSPLSSEQIYEKMAAITAVAATVTVTAGIVLKKNMLSSLVPYIDGENDAVAGTLVVSGDDSTNGLIGIRRTSLATEENSASIVLIPLEVASVDSALYSETQRALVERGLHETTKQPFAIFGKRLVPPVIAAALIALVALPVPIVLSLDAFITPTDASLSAPKESNRGSWINWSSESTEKKTKETAPTAPSASSDSQPNPNKDQKSLTSKPAETPAVTKMEDMKNPDSAGAAQTVVLAVKPGDSVSSLITGYINDMHAAFPGLTLARLGYAQDCLMNLYGYTPIPADMTTFTIKAEDVDHVWMMKEMADAQAAFWADYALRAGIRP